MRVYHLNNCDTCRKAVKEIDAAGLSPDYRDVRADGVDAADLAAIIDAVGWERALNRRSTTWRGLSDAQKADMSAAKAAALIAEHPTLLKRPAIIGGDRATVGWDTAAKAAWL